MAILQVFIALGNSSINAAPTGALIKKSFSQICQRHWGRR